MEPLHSEWRFEPLGTKGTGAVRSMMDAGREDVRARVSFNITTFVWEDGLGRVAHGGSMGNPPNEKSTPITGVTNEALSWGDVFIAAFGYAVHTQLI